MSRRKVAELDTPFSSIEWPFISQEDQDAILELLCTLISPLGQHRRDNVPVSQGQRSRRRKRQQSKTLKEQAAQMDVDLPNASSEIPSGAISAAAAVSETPDTPPVPELVAYVHVGLANITRTLVDGVSWLDAKDSCIRTGNGPLKPLPGQKQLSRTLPPPPSPPPPSAALSPPYTSVFVVRSGHPSAFHSHFPQMVAAASPPGQPIRLVGFSRACEARLSACLGIPRVSSIALLPGAPQAQGLLRFLQERVPPVKALWLEEAQKGHFRDTRIHMADVSVGPKKKKALA